MPVISNSAEIDKSVIENITILIPVCKRASISTEFRWFGLNTAGRVWFVATFYG